MEFVNKDTLWKLTGCVQHYPWGGQSYIPELLCRENIDKVPFAELWFGQHPACPSKTSDGGSLDERINSSPEYFFTPHERQKWNDELPFLCKILDVRDMLSIQIHPAKSQAGEGWEMEEQAGTDQTAFHRSFKDRNHKPEIMYALSEFYLLHDFREDQEIIDILERKEPLVVFANDIRENGLSRFYRTFMQLSQESINQALRPFVRLMEELDVSEDPMNPDYWVKKALDQYCTPQKIDRGIISIYLMNLVHLRPGEVMFQGSGIPHAYLRGQNVEVMANSDNVIRGGLTLKYIDADALSRLVRFDERTLHQLEPIRIDQSRTVFEPPVEEFEFSVIELLPNKEYALNTSGVSLLFSICNCFTVRSVQQEIRVSGGEAVLARADQRITLKSRKEAKVFFVNSRP